jgi:putative transposase
VAALIAARRVQDGIPHAVACRALGVSRSWFYKHKSGRLPPRVQRRERLKAEVARLFAVHEGKYGSPRIAADLRDAGWRVSENTVAVLMREQHLAARRKKKRKGMTRPGKGRWRAPDLVKRDFPATQINTKWYGDGTEIPTGEGKLYLASVLDMASRRVLGFALGEHHDAQLAYGALAMAAAMRGGEVPGVIMHTDRLNPPNTPPAPSARPAAGWASASRWAGPGPRWITRSSSPGIRPWNLSCARWSTSPPGPQRGPGSPPGSRTTTTTGATQRCR